MNGTAKTRHNLLSIPVLFALIVVSLVGESSAHILRSSCNRNALFDNTRTGYRLPGHVLETVQVAQPIDCVIKCADHVACVSVNYEDTGTASNPCELNSKRDVDVTLTVDSTSVYYGPTTLEPNCSTLAGLDCKNGALCVQSCPDEKFQCNCPIGRKCADEVPPFDVQFTRHSVEDYISVGSDTVADHDTFTLLFWVNTLAPGAVAVLSYGVTGSVNELLLMLDGEKLVLTVQTVSTSTFYIPPVNDGFWHHLGIVRNQTEYTAFLDGVRLTSVSDLGTSDGLKSNGVFVIGQKMNAVGADFDTNYAFSGSLTQLNVWSIALTDEVIKNASSVCVSAGTVEEKDVLNWHKLKELLSGQLVRADTSNCKSLRGDIEYDIVMHTASSTETTYAISPEQATADITAYTLALWVKFGSYSSGRLVYYSTSVNKMKTGVSSHGYQKIELEGGAIIHRLDLPFFNGDWLSWHHYSTTWSNNDGRLVVYVDGSMVAVTTGNSVGRVLPKGGKFVIGNYQASMGQGMSAQDAFRGVLSRVNIWDSALDGEAIWAMAKGPLLANGNLFNWYNIRQKAVGPVVFQGTPQGLRYQRGETDIAIGFPTRSIENYARVDNPFAEDLTKLGICYWAIFTSLGKSQVVAYSTTSYDSEITVYMYWDSILFGMHYDESQLIYIDIASAYWNFYCMNWQSTDGKLTYYINGNEVGGGTLRAGYTVAKGGVLILGQEPDGYASGFEPDQAMHGHIAELNIWSRPLPVPSIQAMASGVMNINGDLVRWSQFTQSIVGQLDVVHVKDIQLPGYPTQKKRDAYCNNLHPGFYARYTAQMTYGYHWRCINPSFLFAEGRMVINNANGLPDTTDTFYYSELATVF